LSHSLLLGEVRDGILCFLRVSSGISNV
jgi:hypothetical protein